jgi:hypothetical protein
MVGCFKLLEVFQKHTGDLIAHFLLVAIIHPHFQTKPISSLSGRRIKGGGAGFI